MPPWPPGQLTDGELERRRQELVESIALLPPTSAKVDRLRAELDQIEAERQARTGVTAVTRSRSTDGPA
jgi:Tfp pilus assembly protein PilN